MPVILALRRLSQEDHKSNTSLNYTVLRNTTQGLLHAIQSLPLSLTPSPRGLISDCRPP